MSQDAIPDEILMAYADGELEPEFAKAVKSAADGDPEVSQRLARFTETRARLLEAGHVRPPAPVPDDLRDRVQGILDTGNSGAVLDFASASAARWQPVALAASIALAIGLGAGFLAGNDRSGTVAAPVPGLLDIARLAPALDELPSGETRALDAGSLTVIVSFRDDQGDLCREFEFDAAARPRRIVSIACHGGEGWDTRLAIVTDAANDDSYVPASSIDTLETYLHAIGAGPALPAEEEMQALRALGG
jgi:hypothetical protein